MAIGRKLIPTMIDSKALPPAILFFAFALVALEAPPVELWILPLCVLSADRTGLFARYAASGHFLACVAFFLMGRIFGGSGAVSFIIDTTGLKGIHDYQAARETFGEYLPFFAGWIAPLVSLGGGHFPSLRDTCVLAGQRQLLSSVLFVLLVALQAAIRAVLLVTASRIATKSPVACRYATDAAILSWAVLILVMLI